MYIRFYFHSDYSNYYEGFQIDDLKITVLTNTNNAYEYFNGTSMATPIVSGIAGLVKANSPGLTNIQIKALIETNVDTLGSLAGLVATGGRVNANNIFLLLPAPSGLTATTVSTSQINLTWTDNSSNETGFRIERKTGVGGTYAEIGSVGLDVVTYSDTGLSGSTNYFYRVRAYNSAGNSNYSNEADATTLAYDATGTWTYTETSAWDNCDPAQPESGTVTVTQTGNYVELVDGEGHTFTGTVSGSTYTLSGTYPEDFGTTSEDIIFTLSSDTSGSGTSSWTWTGSGGPCNGGSVFTVTKQAPPPPSGGGGGSSGGGCFISTATFGL
jgi:hypothetical protein